MARIAGIDLPREKRVEVALTYIFRHRRAHRAQAARIRRGESRRSC